MATDGHDDRATTSRAPPKAPKASQKRPMNEEETQAFFAELDAELPQVRSQASAKARVHVNEPLQGASDSDGDERLPGEGAGGLRQYLLDDAYKPVRV
jgi:hypothetical protein